MARFDAATTQLPLWSERDASWTVRESRRARRLIVRVLLSGRVEVVVPPRTSARQVDSFVARHRRWIERKQREVLSGARATEAFPPASIELAACGETWRVHLAGGAGRPRARGSAEGLLSISGTADDTLELRRALRVWLIERGREALAAELATCARELGLAYTTVRVRRQRSRWGSCSTRGTISLNCCLLFQRPEVVRYLLIHELAHTRHMNHSPHFWQLVARHCPDHRALDRELLDGWRRVPSWVFGDS